MNALSLLSVYCPSRLGSPNRKLAVLYGDDNSEVRQEASAGCPWELQITTHGSGHESLLQLSHAPYHTSQPGSP